MVTLRRYQRLLPSGTAKAFRNFHTGEKPSTMPKREKFTVKKGTDLKREKNESHRGPLGCSGLLTRLRNDVSDTDPNSLNWMTGTFTVVDSQTFISSGKQPAAVRPQGCGRRFLVFRTSY